MYWKTVAKFPLWILNIYDIDFSAWKFKSLALDYISNSLYLFVSAVDYMLDNF